MFLGKPKVFWPLANDLLAIFDRTFHMVQTSGLMSGSKMHHQDTAADIISMWKGACYKAWIFDINAKSKEVSLTERSSVTGSDLLPRFWPTPRGSRNAMRCYLSQGTWNQLVSLPNCMNICLERSFSIILVYPLELLTHHDHIREWSRDLSGSIWRGKKKAQVWP